MKATSRTRTTTMAAPISMVEFKAKIPWWWLFWEPWWLLPWKYGGCGGGAIAWIAINSHEGKIRVGEEIRGGETCIDDLRLEECSALDFARAWLPQMGGQPVPTHT